MKPNDEKKEESLKNSKNSGSPSKGDATMGSSTKTTSAKASPKIKTSLTDKEKAKAKRKKLKDLGCELTREEFEKIATMKNMKE